MSNAQRVLRLEQAQTDRYLRQQAIKIGTECGMPPEEAITILEEVVAEINRWGVEGADRRAAAELGMTYAQYRRELRRIAKTYGYGPPKKLRRRR